MRLQKLMLLLWQIPPNESWHQFTASLFEFCLHTGTRLSISYLPASFALANVFLHNYHHFQLFATGAWSGPLLHPVDTLFWSFPSICLNPLRHCSEAPGDHRHTSPSLCLLGPGWLFKSLMTAASWMADSETSSNNCIVWNHPHLQLSLDHKESRRSLLCQGIPFPFEHLH